MTEFKVGSQIWKVKDGEIHEGRVINRDTERVCVHVKRLGGDQIEFWDYWQIYTSRAAAVEHRKVWRES
jgi:hypothetical protein